MSWFRQFSGKGVVPATGKTYGELFKEYLDSIASNETTTVDMWSSKLKLYGAYYVDKENGIYSLSHSQGWPAVAIQPSMFSLNYLEFKRLENAMYTEQALGLERFGYRYPKIKEATILQLKEGDIRGAPTYYELSKMVTSSPVPSAPPANTFSVPSAPPPNASYARERSNAFENLKTILPLNNNDSQNEDPTNPPMTGGSRYRRRRRTNRRKSRKGRRHTHHRRSK